MGWDTVREILYGLAPTAGVVLVFYLVIRAILRADESERQAARQFGDGVPDAAPGESGAPATGNPDAGAEQDPTGDREDR